MKNQKANDVVYSFAKVLAWKFSHYTGNGNPVHKFTIETPLGLTIEGKTAPNNCFSGTVPNNPDLLAHVTIRTTASGRVVMTQADNVA